MNFGEWMRQRMKALGLTNKELAHRLREQCGEGEVDTFKSKASKLVNGDPEGERYFASDDKRLAALASVLETPLDELRDHLARSRATITLVLDPRLAEEFVEFVERPTDRFQVLRVPASEDLRAALRDTARTRQRNAIVVVEKLGAGDEDFFRGADVRTTTYRKVPRGWILDELPDLLPIDPAPAPILRSADGRRMFPSARTTDAVVRDRDDYRWRERNRRARAILELDGTPTYTLEELEMPGVINRRPESPSHAELVSTWSNEPGPSTYIWEEDDQLFRLGPETDGITELARSHALTVPAWLDCYFREIERRSPFQVSVVENRIADSRGAYIASPEAKQIMQVIRSTGGPDCSRALAEWSASARRELEERPRKPVVARCKSGKSEELFGLLRDVCGREFELDDRSAATLLELDWATRCERHLVIRWDPDLAHALIDVGAGNLLDVRVLRFPAEKALVFRSIRAEGYHVDHRTSVFDGGDLRIELRVHHSTVLEGSRTSLSSARRRKTAGSAADEDDD